MLMMFRPLILALDEFLLEPRMSFRFLLLKRWAGNYF